MKFKSLKSKVIDNLKNGVKYIYFVSSNFDKSNINDYFSDEPKVLKNIHLIYIDTWFFKTYYTLHFIENNPKSPIIYMSSLLKVCCYIRQNSCMDLHNNVVCAR